MTCHNSAVFWGPRCSSSTSMASARIEEDLYVMVFVVMFVLMNEGEGRNNRDISLVSFNHSIVTGDKIVNLRCFCCGNMQRINRLHMHLFHQCCGPCFCIFINVLVYRCQTHYASN